MSRTIRCKNMKVQAYWQRCWSKAFGYDWEYDRNGTVPWYGYFIRERTKIEVWHRVKYLHGESRHPDQRSPSKLYRKWRKQEWRTHNKRELQKELKYLNLHQEEGYEGDYWADPQSCLWDWC